MIQFGTGGWRAVIGEGFTEENVRKVASGIAKWLTEQGKKQLVFVGYDRRKFSKEASEWIADTLAQRGVTVFLSNTYISSPAAMLAVKDMYLDCGLMVTASHNPPEYNGIKVFVEGGRDAPLEITHEIEKCVETGMEPNAKRKKIIPLQVLDAFRLFVQTKLHITGRTPLNIAFDVMYGSAKEPFVTLAEWYCNHVDVINDGVRPDERKGLPAPDKEYIPELLNIMQSGEYDIGFAFDGDGDRIGIVDDKGEYIGPNEAMCILYWYLHEIRGERGCVVKNLCTTERLRTMAEDFGEECYEVPVGFKWVSAKMNETNALIGGESSGGMTFRNYIMGKDSTLTAMLFIEMLTNTGRTLSDIKRELREKYEPSAFLTDNIRYDESKKQDITDFLETSLDALYDSVRNISYMDGVKISFNNGDFMTARFSGTEPLLRFMAEGHTEKDAQSYINICKQAISNL